MITTFDFSRGGDEYQHRLIYQERVDGDVFKVITAVTGVLNTLLSGNLNVKFDISNQKNGPCPRRCFFPAASRPTSPSAQPAVADTAGPPTFAWNAYTWHTADAGDPAYDAMYKGFVDTLNSGALPDGTQLGKSQLKGARAVFTNMHDGPATLSMFYPTS